MSGQSDVPGTVWTQPSLCQIYFQDSPLSLSLSLSLDIDRDGREGDKVFKNIQLLPNNSLSYLDNKIYVKHSPKTQLTAVTILSILWMLNFNW